MKVFRLQLHRERRRQQRRAPANHFPLEGAALGALGDEFGPVVLLAVAHQAEVEREMEALGQGRQATLGEAPASVKIRRNVGALGLVLRLVAVREGGQPQHGRPLVGVERAEAAQPLLEERVLRLGAHDAVGRVWMLVQRAEVPVDAEPRVMVGQLSTALSALATRERLAPRESGWSLLSHG